MPQIHGQLADKWVKWDKWTKWVHQCNHKWVACRKWVECSSHRCQWVVCLVVLQVELELMMDKIRMQTSIRAEEYIRIRILDIKMLLINKIIKLIIKINLRLHTILTTTEKDVKLKFLLLWRLRWWPILNPDQMMCVSMMEIPSMTSYYAVVYFEE